MRCRGTFATQLGALLVLLEITTALHAQSNITFKYFYDDLGQLIKVIDSSGNELVYVYDAVGNILEIKRGSAPASGTLAILNFTPQQGTVGDMVTIQGQGFGVPADANTVKFNGTTATVLSATPSTLTVVVPNGATTGPITISVLSATATSVVNFIIVARPVITSLNRRSALFNTVIPNFAVAGFNLSGAVFSFNTNVLAATGAVANEVGTAARMTLQVGTVAGTFPLIASNSFGSSSHGITGINSFTVVNPNSLTDSDGDGIPDVIEAIFGSDPLDPNSLPNLSVQSSGEVHAEAFSVLNNAGANQGSPINLEADAATFSALNVAGFTGGQPLSMYVNAQIFSVVNNAIGAVGQSSVRAIAVGFSVINTAITTNASAAAEVDAIPFSTLNISAMTAGQRVEMEVNAAGFSVVNEDPSAPLAARIEDGGGGSGSQPIRMEADAIVFSVTNTATGAPPGAIASARSADLPLNGASEPRDKAFLVSRPLVGGTTIILSALNTKGPLRTQYISRARREP